MGTFSEISQNCPKCGGNNSLKNISIRGIFLRQQCENCSQLIYVELPKLNKKVIYLDQNFLSNIFKNKRFVCMGNVIAQLVNDQILVCPYSSVHEIETSLWIDGKKEELMEYIKKFSHYHQFEDRVTVMRNQLKKAVNAYLNKTEVREIGFFDKNEALEKNINDWESGIFVLPIYCPLYNSEEVNELNSAKDNAVRFFIENIPKWQKNKKVTFEEDYEIELKNIKETFNQKFYNVSPDGIYLNLSEIELLPILGSLVSRKPNNTDVIFDFEESNYFSNIPFIRLKAILYASLKKRIRNGWCENSTKAQKELAGIWFDIEFLSVYAPYCDAIFTDKAMHEIISEASRKYPDDFRFEVFSAKNLDKFENYLEEMAKY